MELKYLQLPTVSYLTILLHFSFFFHSFNTHTKASVYLFIFSHTIYLLLHPYLFVASKLSQFSFSNKKYHFPFSYLFSDNNLSVKLKGLRSLIQIPE